MPMTMLLEGASCGDCGEEPYWWSEDETEDTLEVYVTCHNCGREFPKRFVSKSEDTSHGALEEVARDIVGG